jgi:hypothetical protein
VVVPDGTVELLEANSPDLLFAGEYEPVHRAPVLAALEVIARRHGVMR